MTNTLPCPSPQTRKTLSAQATFPPGYHAFRKKRASADTTEVNGGWDEEWVHSVSGTEPVPPRERHTGGDVLLSEIIASVSCVEFVPRSQRKALLKLLLNRHDSTERVDLNLQDPDDEWEQWDVLKAKHSAGTLSAEETQVFRRLQQLVILESQERLRVQERSLAPLIARHEDFLSSLRLVAHLLSRLLQKQP
jgi:hypothetical protein